MSGARGHPFDPRLIAALVAAGVLAFIGFLVLTAYAGDFRSGRDGRPHALSVSAVGFKGLVDLIDYSGRESYLVRSPEDMDSEDLLVVTLSPMTDEEALADLLERRGAQATLLVLPKWLTGPYPLRKSWVTSSDAAPPELAQDTLPDSMKVEIKQAKSGGKALRGKLFLGGMAVRPPPLVQTISGPGVEPLLETEGGAAVLARVNGVYVLADPDLLNNHGLKDKERARAALRLLDELNATDAESIMFDLTLSGFGEEQSALKLAFEPPFLALTATILVAALLAGLHGAARFGPAAEEQRAIAFGKAALVDNSAGLLRLTRREHRVGGAYADLTRESAARDAAAPPDLREDALDAYLNRLAKDGERFTTLADSVRYADDRHALLHAARALFMWKRNISQ